MNPDIHIKTEVVSHANGEDVLMNQSSLSGTHDQLNQQQQGLTSYHTSTIDNSDIRFNPVTFHNVSQLGKYFVLTNLFQGSNIYTTIPKLQNIKSDGSTGAAETNLILNASGQPIGLGSVAESNCTVIQHQSHGEEENQPIHLQLVDPNAMHSKDESQSTTTDQQIASQHHSYSDTYAENMQNIMKPDIKPDSDIRNTVVTITGHDPNTNAKPLEMLKVNIDDFNQFLNYHEVFGKMSTDSPIITPTLIPTSTTVPATTSTAPDPNNGNSGTHLTDSLSTTSAIIGPMSDNVCDLCGKLFQYKYQLIVHRRYHNERKPFTCQVCGEAFQNSAELTFHGKSKHIGESKMYICNVCFHVFPNDTSLERHMKRHSSDKPFLCNICMRTFNRREHLENHQRTHTGDCPFR